MTGHTFADGPSAEYDRDLYYREVGGSTEARCLACQAWLPLAREGEACPEGIRLVIGLKYQIRIADEPEVHTALFLKVPEHPLDGTWYVYDPDRGSAVHPHKYVTVVGVDLEHAFGLWDAIAGAVGPMDASDRYATDLGHRTLAAPTIEDIADPKADREIHGPVTLTVTSVPSELLLAGQQIRVSSRDPNVDTDPAAPEER